MKLQWMMILIIAAFIFGGMGCGDSDPSEVYVEESGLEGSELVPDGDAELVADGDAIALQKKKLPVVRKRIGAAALGGHETLPEETRDTTRETEPVIVSLPDQKEEVHTIDKTPVDEQIENASGVINENSTLQYEKYKKMKVDVVLPEPDNVFSSQIKNEVKGKSFTWKPIKRSDGTNMGLPWLLGAQLSEDGSILVVTEKLGKDPGPYGTRIIFLGLYDLKVKNVVDVDFLIQKFYINEKRKSIIAQCPAQKELKQRNAIIEFSVINGIERQYLRLIPDNTLRDFVFSHELQKVAITYNEEDYVYVFDADNLNAINGKNAPIPPTTIHVGFSGKDNTLAVFTPKEATFHNANDLTPSESMKINGVGMFNLGSRYIWCTDLGFVNHDNYVKFKEKCVFFSMDNNTFYSMGVNSKRIYIRTILPYDDTIAPIEYLKLAPVTKVDPVIVSYTQAGRRIVYLDRAGSLYLLTRPVKGKTWKKVVVFQAEK